MKKINLLGLVLISMTAFAEKSIADIYVISNPDVSITGADVNDVFLGEKQTAGGKKLTPVDNKAAQEGFLAQVLKMPLAKYSGIWAKKGFRDGLTAPAVKASDAEVIDTVKSSSGAVGYITSAPGAGVKLIQKY